MRINKMITIEKMVWSFIKFSQLILKGDIERSVWGICKWILGLKGLNTINVQLNNYIQVYMYREPKFLPLTLDTISNV